MQNQSSGIENKIMFIGDSWTYGAEADDYKGFADILVEMLNKKNIQAEAVNYGMPGLNSSESCIHYIHNTGPIKPAIVIALFGSCDSSNTLDVELCYELFDHKLAGAAGPGDILKNYKKSSVFDRLRIVRLFNHIRHELFIESQDMLYPYPYPCSEFGETFISLKRTAGNDKALEYITENYAKAESYDNFYRYVLYYFSFDSEMTKSYLISKGIWYPEKLKMQFDSKKHEEKVKTLGFILSRNIYFLKKACDIDRVELILQTYPISGQEKFAKVNQVIRQTAEQYNIRLVDQEKIFESMLDRNTWSDLLGKKNHVNSAGHRLMASNLYNYLTENKLLIE